MKMKRCLAIGVLGVSFVSQTQAFNSEEHKLITDRGIALVEIPTSVVLPAQALFANQNPDEYLGFLKSAKTLAAGFDTNNTNDFDKSKAAVQDNCYWYTYMQLDYNKKIRIPERGRLPEKVFYVPAYTGSQAAPFSIGELSAIYGDYRRTTHCSTSGKCYLSNEDIQNVEFERGNVYYKDFYCPKPVASETYLRAIGSGVVPPFGSLGNNSANTANNDEYQEAGWWGDEMLRIANVNDWHFSSAGVAWYTGMHRLALLNAAKAKDDPKYWITALHYEANALHSLVDLFAFGHVVTNRGESSHGMIKNKSLQNTRTYQWMENVMRVGGGQRAADGKITVQGELPAIADLSTERSDFLESDRGSWWLWARYEQVYHDEFNKSGAVVKNLNGDTFNAYGDGRLHALPAADRLVIQNAVTTSVQALFEAYDAMVGGDTVESIGAKGSSYFAALKYVPAYIVSDENDYFPGRWALYAKAIDDISGAGRVPSDWQQCKIPFLSGADWHWPASHDSCMPFES